MAYKYVVIYQKRESKLMSPLYSLLHKLFSLPKPGARYASVFVGRCDDNSVAGLEVVRSVSEVYSRQGVRTQVLSASIRDVYKVTRSFYNGASIVTMPPKIFHKMYDHVLTDAGMEIFNKDAGL